MDALVKSLYHFGGLMRGFPPTISPALEDFELMQYIRQPLIPAADDFRILLNVKLFQPHDIEIYVLDKKVVEIRAKHDRRQNFDGLWLTRDCTYTYELPPVVCGKELHAEWSKDDYLLIQATSSKCDEDDNLIRLVPEHVQVILKPVVELGVVRDMTEDIRDKAQHVLRYIRFHTQDVPDAAKVMVDDADSKVGQGESKDGSDNVSPSAQTDESQSSNGNKTDSSGRDSKEQVAK